jgi:lysine-N-methylase
MKSKLRTLPILEQWDCHHCTACCRETTIQLNANDLERLESQGWDKHPQYRGIQVVHRSLWLAGAIVLAHKADGSCVFLTESGRCRIHELFGASAKPSMCQLFPLQVVKTDRENCLTTQRSCPSAAADRGPPLSEHLNFVRQLLGGNSRQSPTTAPPLIAHGARRSWDSFHLATDALQRLLVDERLPLVRKLVHCLRFCALLEQCKWKRVEADSTAELITLLEQSASDEVGHYFEDRQPPKPRTARLFRRLGAHFIRCYPGGRPTRTLLDHWRVFRLSGCLAKATSSVPELHPRFPSIDLEQLERPLGPLMHDTMRPLNRFFDTHAASKRYALAHPTSTVVESFRRLSFAFPMALWLLRWSATEREPVADAMVQIVVALERGLEMSSLTRATSYLAHTNQLEQLIAWYGR